MPSIADQNSTRRFASSYRAEFGESWLRTPAESVMIIAISSVKFTRTKDYVRPPFLRETHPKVRLGASWRLCTAFPQSTFA